MFISNFLKSVFYLVLLLLAIVSTILLVKYITKNGSSIQAASYCENNLGRPMKIKRIITIDNNIAEIQMEDDSIQSYIVKEYIWSPKGSSVKHIKIQINDIICIKK